MITACERIGREMAPVEGGVRMYHEREDAAFIDAAYRAFQTRELFSRVCALREDEQIALDRSVADALRNSRGTTTRERSRRRRR